MLTEAQIREEVSNQQRQASALVERWSNMPSEYLKRFQMLDECDKQSHLNFLEGISDPWRKYCVARLLENTYHTIANMSETVRTSQIGGFEKFLFPMIVAVFGNAPIDEIFSVQPLPAPNGTVFFMDVLAGSTKGNIAKGSALFNALNGPSATRDFASETVNSEQLGTGDGATFTYTGTLSYLPIRPGSVEVTDGVATLKDNGQGTLSGDGTGTINYATGVISVTFNYASVADAVVAVTYQYDSELSESVPQLDIRLQSTFVITQPRKLSYYWSVEAQQDLKNLHGMDIEPTLLGYAQNEIIREIFNDLVAYAKAVAAAGNVTWSRTPPVGVQWYFHKQQLRDTLVEAGNLILTATRRFTANRLIAGTELSSIVQVLDGFKPVSAAAGIAGIRKIGTLDNLEVYLDPDYTTNEGLLVHKGPTFLEAALAYCPYLGFFTTDTITLPDMKARKGLMQRSGRKLINANHFATIKVTA